MPVFQNQNAQALGIDPQVELELHEYDVLPGDIYLLCSDGLVDLVDDEEIQLTASSLASNLELTVQQLVQANGNGGKENIPAILVRPLRPFPAGKEWEQRYFGWLHKIQGKKWQS